MYFSLKSLLVPLALLASLPAVGAVPGCFAGLICFAGTCMAGSEVQILRRNTRQRQEELNRARSAVNDGGVPSGSEGDGADVRRDLLAMQDQIAQRQAREEYVNDFQHCLAQVGWYGLAGPALLAPSNSALVFAPFPGMITHFRNRQRIPREREERRQQEDNLLLRVRRRNDGAGRREALQEIRAINAREEDLCYGWLHARSVRNIFYNPERRPVASARPAAVPGVDVEYWTDNLG